MALQGRRGTLLVSHPRGGQTHYIIQYPHWDPVGSAAFSCGVFVCPCKLQASSLIMSAGLLLPQLQREPL